MSDTPERPQHGPDPRDLDALKDGAALLVQAGNRVAALSLLWSAVAIDPRDLGAHRRLAAILANAGDLNGAAEEFARYIEFVLPLGDISRATLELSYGVNMVGGHQALHGAAQKIASAVLALVPATNTAIAAETNPWIAAETNPWIAATTAAPAAVAAAPLPSLPSPRLLPKVPFRFCLHPGGERQWMQLEGGMPGLVPDAVRVIDKWDHVVEERLCMPLAKGEGHATNANSDTPAVAWVVVGIPNPVAAAYDAGMTWSYTFQAKVDDEWLALDLVDSGCRLGRVRTTAVS